MSFSELTRLNLILAFSHVLIISTLLMIIDKKFQCANILGHTYFDEFIKCCGRDF